MAEDQQKFFRDLIAGNTTDSPKPEGERTARGVMSVIGQGLSLGTADEIEAFLRSKLRNENYEDVLAEIRGSIEDYRNANPIQSTLVEGGAAAIPMVAAALLTGGGSLIPQIAANASRFPALTRVMRGLGVVPTSGLRGAAAAGATTGAAYGFASGEGDALNRAQSAGYGALGGAVAGPVAEAAGQVVGGLAVGAIDHARRMIGNRGSKIVERELQRIAGETGQSMDDIVQGIFDGNVLAENATLREVVKGYKATGGPAGTQLSSTLNRRDKNLRQAAESTMQKTLTNTKDPNIRRGNLELQRLAKETEDELYLNLERQLANGEVVQAATDAVNRVPGAMKELNEALQAQNLPPLFEMPEGGSALSATRTPNVKEVEIIRRTIKNLATKRYRGGKGTAGEAFQDVAGTLEQVLDENFPDAQVARKTAATNRDTRDAFNDGQAAFAKDKDQIQIDFNAIEQKGQQPVKAFKAGVMQSIRQKLAGPQRSSFITKLATEGTKERSILEIISGDQELDSMLRAIVRADKSSQAAKAVNEYGAQKTIEATKAQGSNVGMGDIFSAGMYGDPMAIVRILSKQVDTTQPGLSPKERDKVVQVLLSKDPDFVSSMLKDQSGMMRAQSAIEGVVQMLRAAGTRAGQQMGSVDAMRMQQGQPFGLLGAF